MQTSTNGFSITVTPQVQDAQQKRLEHDAFAGREASTGEIAEGFYIATKTNDEIVGVVSITEADRPVVAALVGNWIADGHVVTRANTKDLLRKLRAAQQKEKSAVALADPSAGSENQPEGAPVVPVAASAAGAEAGTLSDASTPPVSGATGTGLESRPATHELHLGSSGGTGSLDLGLGAGQPVSH